MATLYIVATPIGNFQDISLRALEILKGVDLILCENPERTKKILEYYQIKKPLFRYHQHSKISQIALIKNLFKKDKNLALVCDAGTPGISDPGGKLVALALQWGVKVVPIPGPSAFTTLLSVSGWPMEKFFFFGFLPKKKKREKTLRAISQSKYPIVFYESPHRIIKTLTQLEKMEKNLELVVGRELTKKFEKVYRGKIEGVIEEIKKDKIKGEFVILVRKIK